MGCVWLIYRKWGYAIGGNIVTRKRSLIPWGMRLPSWLGKFP